MKELIRGTKHEKDLRIFALCQKCHKHIFKCVDFLETKDKGVLFRIRCPHCGWEFGHQIFVSQESAMPPLDIEKIAAETMVTG